MQAGEKHEGAAKLRPLVSRRIRIVWPGDLQSVYHDGRRWKAHGNDENLIAWHAVFGRWEWTLGGAIDLCPFPMLTKMFGVQFSEGGNGPWAVALTSVPFRC